MTIDLTPSGLPQLIKEFYAIVTSDVPEGVPPGEHVMAVMLPNNQTLPLVTHDKKQIEGAWKNLMASPDPQFKGKTYRLIRIYGSRFVVHEESK